MHQSIKKMCSTPCRKAERENYLSVLCWCGGGEMAWPCQYNNRKGMLVWPGNQFGPDELNSIFSKKYCIKNIFAMGSQNILM